MTGTPVGILGAGAWGTALAHVVAGRGGGDVWLYCEDAQTAREITQAGKNERRLPGVAIDPRVRASADLAEVTAAAHLLILAVPSTRVADTVRALGPVVDGRHAIVHAIGAVAPVPGESGTRVSDLVRAETPVKRIGALAGPALARDLVDGRPCAVVVASAFHDVMAQARAALDVPSLLRVYKSQDLLGVELASGLSGAMTVAIGMADGLGVGPGVRAVLMCRAVAEMARIGAAAGAKERTFGGLAGLGNLLVRASSSSSERSDDYQLGVALARGGVAFLRETEGARAARSAVPMARRYHVRTPILDAVVAVLSGTPVKVAAAKLFETTAEEE